jgi:hypothetical protein
MKYFDRILLAVFIFLTGVLAGMYLMGKIIVTGKSSNMRIGRDTVIFIHHYFKPKH